VTDEPHLRTPLCDSLGCRYPILQAGMGGVARAELVAAVAEAGGYGFLGMVREKPALIAREIDAVRAKTDKPFGVNLVPAATDPALLDAELALCFDKKVHSVCFFWSVRADLVARARDAGCLVLYQVGSVEDAAAAERAGADVIIAQGVEAGGHVHGTVSSLVLLPSIVRAVSVPVVGSGGFASGESLIAALALGAQGIHCGTAFLATEESFAHDRHKARVVAAGLHNTVLTDAFAINWPPSSPVRVIANQLTDQLGQRLFGHRADDIPREAIADEEGRPIYAFSTDSPLRTTTGDLERLALFAGQVAGAIDTVPSAAARIAEIVDGARAALARLQRMGTAAKPCTKNESADRSPGIDLGDDDAPYASPPCFLHELDPSYLGYMSTPETIDLLNALLEGGRAGARGLAEMTRQTPRAADRTTLRAIARDEARFCAILTRHITRLGGSPSAKTAAFYQKLIDLRSFSERVALLDRGLAWVVRTLQDSVHKVGDDVVFADLTNMLDLHEQNIRHCKDLGKDLG
jgi:nitronate monooxygenase